MKNFIIIILDGVGIGELPDSHLYHDEGSNTLANTALKVGGLSLPNLQALGLGNISKIEGIDAVDNPKASFGKMKEISKGKDSTTGHWEIGGLYVDLDFSYFPNGFPNEITDNFLKLTGFPIIYTSADSVFQIAAHEEIIPLEKLYEICRITQDEVLTLPIVIGRVIARPFVCSPGNYSRTVNR